MRKVGVTNNLSLDGVMQAPGRPDEDTRGGFKRGGWALPYNDEVMGRVMGEGTAQTGASAGAAHLRGLRRLLAPPNGQPLHRRPGQHPEIRRLDDADRTAALDESTLLQSDAAEAVAALKDQPGPDIAILGSGELIQSLRSRNLIDEYILLVHPLILGSGRRLFPDGAVPSALRLTNSVTTTIGVVIATYETV